MTQKTNITPRELWKNKSLNETPVKTIRELGENHCKLMNQIEDFLKKLENENTRNRS